LFLFFLVAACSSAPQRPAEITAQRGLAQSQLELVNREAERGNNAYAAELLADARRIAVAYDDPELLVRTGIAAAAIYDQSGAAEEAEKALREARGVAEEEGNAALLALCRLAAARVALRARPRDAETARDAGREARAALAVFAKKSLNAAAALTLAALAGKEAGDYAGAAAALRAALAIHLEGRYLEAAAYDYYLIASVYSVSGEYEKAREALRGAIRLDRRAENSYGLGMDYLAQGDIYRKAGDAAAARAAYRRAEAIFRAANRNAGAETAASRAAALGKDEK
jgi:tetratricopeptide (TPR) repeat protein